MTDTAYTRVNTVSGKSWDITAWVHDGEIYCPTCADQKFSPDQFIGCAIDCDCSRHPEKPHPTFADADYTGLACRSCAQPLDGTAGA